MSAFRGVDDDYVIQVAIDAVMLGEEEAKKKHNVSQDTLWRYKKAIRSDAELAKQYAALYIQLNRDSLAQARKKKDRALEILMQRMESCNELKEVTAAYKVLAESFLAENIALGLDPSTSKGVGEQGVSELRTKRSGRRDHESAPAAGASTTVREASSGDTTIVIPGTRTSQ